MPALVRIEYVHARIYRESDKVNHLLGGAIYIKIYLQPKAGGIFL